MKIRNIKFILMMILAMPLVAIGELHAYIQRDSRGFPASQAPRSPSFGMPIINIPPPVSPPIYVQQPQQQKNHHYRNKHHHKDNFPFNYYNSGVYPYNYGVYSSPLYVDTFHTIQDDNRSTHTTYEEPAKSSSQSNTLPNGIWIAASNGYVPDKAFVYRLAENTPTYFCRVLYKSTTYYGVLTANIGCYIEDQSVIIRFNQYEVLVSQE